MVSFVVLPRTIFNLHILVVQMRFQCHPWLPWHVYDILTWFLFMYKNIMSYLFYGNGSFILWKWQQHDSFISRKTQMRAQALDYMGCVLERGTNQRQGAASRFITSKWRHHRLDRRSVFESSDNTMAVFSLWWSSQFVKLMQDTAQPSGSKAGLWPRYPKSKLLLSHVCVLVQVIILNLFITKFKLSYLIKLLGWSGCGGVSMDRVLFVCLFRGTDFYQVPASFFWGGGLLSPEKLVEISATFHLSASSFF